jgi:hypothetical protein
LHIVELSNGFSPKHNLQADVSLTEYAKSSRQLCFFNIWLQLKNGCLRFYLRISIDLI